MKSHLEVIQPYLDFVTTIFGGLSEDANRHKVAPDTMARDYLSDEHRRQRFSGQMQDICRQIKQFWQSNDRSLRDCLRKLPGLKAGFAGDVGPQPSDFVFERAGLYFHTIVVRDPLLHVATIPKELSARKDYYLVKYGIIQCQLKDLYLAKTTPPIAYLLGDPGMLAGPLATGPAPFELAFLDAVMLVNELYGTKFDSFDEVNEYFEHFVSNEEAIRNLAKPDLFLFDPNAEPNPEAQWATVVELLAQDMEPGGTLLGGRGASLVGQILSGRMGQAVDILHRTAEQGFHPLVTAPVSYHWMTQKIRINQKHVGEGLDIDFKDLAVTNALLRHENRWIGNLTLDQLIELRQRNELEDLRTELTRNLDVLSKASLNDLDSLVVQVDQNLKRALEKHGEQIKEIDRRLLQSLAISVPTLLVSIVAALQPTIGAILPSWLPGLLGVTSLKDLINGFVGHARERNAQARSPIGVLWSARKVK